MTEQTLTAVAFANPNSTTMLMTSMGIGTGHPVEIAMPMPYFQADQALTAVQRIGAQVIFFEATVPGYDKDQALGLRQASETPVILIGLAQAGSSEMEQMIDAGFDKTYPMPLSPSSIEKMKTELPTMYEQIAEGWKSGAWGSAVPTSVRNEAASRAGTSWQKTAIACWSPKGGVGKTWTSIELAAALAALGGRKVALLDINANGGHIRTRLNVSGSASLLKAASVYARNVQGHQSVSREIPGQILSMMIPAAGLENMLHILPGLDSMEQARHDHIAGQAGMDFVRYLMGFLRNHYDFVIADLGSSVNVGLHRGVLMEVDRVLTISDQDLSGIEDVRKVIERELLDGDTGMSRKTFGLVINRYMDEVGISLKAAADHAGVTPLAYISNDPSGRTMKCGNDGISYFAAFSKRADNPAETEATLSGIVQLAAQFYPPIAATWAHRSTGAPVGSGRGNNKKGFLDKLFNG